MVTRLLPLRVGDALARIKSDDKIVALITSAKGSPISGAELCWETRLLSGRQRPIYVLLMSSSSDCMAKIEALDCGANDVIDEPPPLDELCAKLRMAERMISLQRELMRSATTDPLSGVYNRGGFFDEATELCREASDGGSLAVILLDVDRLKEINDRYGHDAGDNAIRGVAAVAQVFGAPVGATRRRRVRYSPSRSCSSRRLGGRGRIAKRACAVKV